MKTPTPLLLSSFVLLAACAGEPQAPATPATPASTRAAEAPAAATETLAPADAFMARLAQHCGEAFAGRIITDEPPPQGEDPFAGKPLVMHVRECTAGELRVPFHVGDDHSRTWVITRTDTGLRLKHDHRHEDGSSDAVTMMIALAYIFAGAGMLMWRRSVNQLQGWKLGGFWTAFLGLGILQFGDKGQFIIAAIQRSLPDGAKVTSNRPQTWPCRSA